MYKLDIAALDGNFRAVLGKKCNLDAVALWH